MEERLKKLESRVADLEVQVQSQLDINIFKSALDEVRINMANLLNKYTEDMKKEIIHELILERKSD